MPKIVSASLINYPDVTASLSNRINDSVDSSSSALILAFLEQLRVVASDRSHEDTKIFILEL